MPKLRQTCTRCSMRRQKCDKQKPCGRCVMNKEPHLCTTEWTNGYNPSVHRKYPRKSSPTDSQRSATLSGSEITSLDSSQQAQSSHQPWPTTPISRQDLPTHFRTQDSSIHGTARPPLQESTQSSANLDFITFGRPDFADVNIGNILSSKEGYARNKAAMNESLNQVNKQFDNTETSGFSPAARAVEVYHIQSLLPTKDLLLRMVDYHERFMLYWSGGIYHAPSFRKSLIAGYGQTDDLELQNMDWRWTALLFSILSASIIGSPEGISTSWGYLSPDKVRLARQWGIAAISCLHLGDYASKFHIYSVQAILNMHTSEHLVGSTKEWAVYQGAALVIARGLGLHRLIPHPDDGKSTELDVEQKEALIQREMGRRAWLALTSQDWLCSTSQGMYTIQKKHFTSIKPGYYDDETMTPIVDETPTPTHVGNYLNEVAFILISYHDDMLDAPDLATKYNTVLQYDGKMRALYTEKVPKCLSLSTPFNPSWPRWVAWARRLHQASCAHKIIMIHQIFLGRSFKSPQFTYSRWACVSSAKTIIEYMSGEREPEEPQWWVEQAFVVTAGICIALDFFHRSEKDPEIREHQHWVEKTIKILEQWPTSSVAVHGVRLLSSLLHEHVKKHENSRPNPPPAGHTPAFPDNISPIAIARTASEATQVQPPLTEPTTVPEGWGAGMLDVEMLGFDDLMDTLPMEATLDNNLFFESMLGLANSQFF